MIQFTHLDVNELMIQKCKRTYDIYQLVVMYQQFVDIFKRQKCVSSSLTS